MDDIHFDRESNKFGLSQFLDDLSLTSLDSSIDSLIKELSSDLSKAYELVHEAYKENNSYDLQEVYLIEEQISSIIEMKIIHLYKGVEIHTKKIISAAFDIDTNNMYKWDNLLSFLDGKDILYKELNGFREVNELRLVNNHLKHWIKGQKNRTSHIQEFSGKEIDYRVLMNFYNRVKPFPIKWIIGLRDSIYDNLYVFDDNRLDELANKLVLTMDQKTMTKYVKILSSKY